MVVIILESANVPSRNINQGEFIAQQYKALLN